MASRRRYTQELLKARDEHGRTIVASTLDYPGPSRTKEWPVVYRPRNSSDPRPWLELLADGTEPKSDEDMRWTGRGCTIESRYRVHRLSLHRYQVQDVVEDKVVGNFAGDAAWRLAAETARDLVRADRAEVLGRPRAAS